MRVRRVTRNIAGHGTWPLAAARHALAYFPGERGELRKCVRVRARDWPRERTFRRGAEARWISKGVRQVCGMELDIIEIIDRPYDESNDPRYLV